MDGNCGFQGNGDLYGLGVRLGLYIQLLTIGVVSSLLPKSLYSSYFINTNISLFASTWIIIIKESALRDISGVEINIFSILAATQLGATILLVQRHMAMLPAISMASILINILTSGYWTWFFWRGLDVLPRSACPDEYAFFFARVSLYDWFRTLSKVFSVIALVSAVYGEHNCNNVRSADC
ncbi:High-affinity glucose transporter ght2 [Fusarium oxysporum f. sp. albedinis]|nr:High-affinity glucose transporter ght2 [Fusarium oxysporum f. sp. albedinis]